MAKELTRYMDGVKVLSNESDEARKKVEKAEKELETLESLPLEDVLEFYRGLQWRI